MEINEMINFITNIGFPAFIAIYVLTRLEKQVSTLITSFNTLNSSINSLISISKYK